MWGSCPLKCGQQLVLHSFLKQCFSDGNGIRRCSLEQCFSNWFSRIQKAVQVFASNSQGAGREQNMEHLDPWWQIWETPSYSVTVNAAISCHTAFTTNTSLSFSINSVFFRTFYLCTVFSNLVSATLLICTMCTVFAPCLFFLALNVMYVQLCTTFFFFFNCPLPPLFGGRL